MIKIMAPNCYHLILCVLTFTAYALLLGVRIDRLSLSFIDFLKSLLGIVKAK